MFDCHLHTNFSTDSTMLIEEALDNANELGIGITLTEHMDLNCPVKGNFIFNPEDYFKQYSKYRSDKVLLGIELGLDTNYLEQNKLIVDTYPFDYVLGSVHIIGGIDLYYEDYYTGRTKKQAFEEYFKYMIDCLKSHNFIDSLGHIDYISRYARYEDREIYYEDFSEYIDEVLKLAIQNNISLEINTRRFDKKENIKNIEKIYKRYYDLGGRLVTLGSDAHSKDAIGYKLQAAKDLATSLDLKPVYFNERKIEYM